MEDILNYIEQHQLGVQGLQLRSSFPLGDFLLETLHLLADHALVKRVGVVSHIYVHKKHIRNWVVHTFQMNRAQRERIQSQVSAAPGTLPAVVSHKRNADATLVPPEKKMKLMEQVNSTGSESDDEAEGSKVKRSHKVPTRKADVFVEHATNQTLEASRDAIAMRPQPWIRVNASLNRRVLDRWLGAVLSECVSRVGCTVHSLFLKFAHMVPVDIMFLLELLEDLSCIYLVEIRPHKVHVEMLLDNDDQEGEELRATELYDPMQTYIRVHGDAIGRLTDFIGQKKYNTEFI